MGSNLQPSDTPQTDAGVTLLALYLGGCQS